MYWSTSFFFLFLSVKLKINNLMKTNLLVLLSILFSGVCTHALGSNAVSAAKPKKRVIFEENFNQRSSVPDTTRWSLCPQKGAAWSTHLSENYDQAYVKDGKLFVTAQKIDGVYKCGGIESKGKFAFTYGKIEVSARFHTAQGGWPAIWLMPEDRSGEWPVCGEIDIMEQLNHDSIVYQTVHNNYKNVLKHETPKPFTTVPYKVGKFNTYGIEWTPDEVTFTVNGKKTFSYPNLRLADEATVQQFPFNKDFYIILNYALGGPNTWPGEIDDSQLPGYMEVDWVRVTQTK